MNEVRESKKIVYNKTENPCVAGSIPARATMIKRTSPFSFINTISLKLLYNWTRK